MKSTAALKLITWILLILPIGIKYLPSGWQTPELKLFSNFYIVVVAIIACVYAAQQILGSKEPGELEKKYLWVHPLAIVIALGICYSNISAFAKTLKDLL